MLFDAGNDIAIPAGELEKIQNWRAKGNRPFRVNGYKGEGQIHSVQAPGIYEVTIEPASRQRRRAGNWRKAGHLIRRSGGAHHQDTWTPLGKNLVFIAPDSGASTLWLKPVPWLVSPMVAVRHYIGPWDYRGAVSVAVSAQLQALPQQIAETFEVLLDAGETP